MKTILINNPAATSGGALTLLQELIRHVPPDNKYILFTSVADKLTTKGKNLDIIQVDAKSWLKRLWWDNYGLRKWCQVNDIVPALILSMQNTAVRFDDQVKQVVYFQQALPLYNNKWNLFRRDESKLFCYKHFYPFFIKYNISDSTRFIVQLECWKKKFARRFAVAEDRIEVIYPDVSKVCVTSSSKIILPRQVNFFYPAGDYKYKNHVEIVKAFHYLSINNYDISNLQVFFTVENDNKYEFVRLIKQYNLTRVFIFLGQIDYNTTLQYYAACDAVLFPSYIETFGLPLLEAASCGKPILCADLEYAREVAGEYPGIKFLPCGKPERWGEAISDIQFTPQFNNWQSPRGKDSWSNFFAAILQLLE